MASMFEVLEFEEGQLIEFTLDYGIPASGYFVGWIISDCERTGIKIYNTQGQDPDNKVYSLIPISRIIDLTTPKDF